MRFCKQNPFVSWELPAAHVSNNTRFYLISLTLIGNISNNGLAAFVLGVG